MASLSDNRLLQTIAIQTEGNGVTLESIARTLERDLEERLQREKLEKSFWLDKACATLEKRAHIEEEARTRAHQGAASEKTNEILENMNELLGQNIEFQVKLLKSSNTSTSLMQAVHTATLCHENRHCELYGEGTDAARNADFFQRGESAILGSKIVETLVKNMVEYGNAKALEYRFLFGHKDLSRAEALASHFYVTFVEQQISSFTKPSYERMGSLGYLIPSFRGKLIREFKAQKNQGRYEDIEVPEFIAMLGEVPRDVQILQRLVLPVGKKIEILEESKFMCELRQASRNCNIENKWIEVAEIPMTSEPHELFKELSPELQNFFENHPSCKSMNPRIRVTQGLIGWMFHTNEIAKMTDEIALAKYYEKLRKSNLEKQSWEIEKAKVFEWACKKYPSLGHGEIAEQYEALQAANKAEKSKQASYDEKGSHDEKGSNHEKGSKLESIGEDIEGERQGEGESIMEKGLLESIGENIEPQGRAVEMPPPPSRQPPVFLDLESVPSMSGPMLLDDSQVDTSFPETDVVM